MKLFPLINTLMACCSAMAHIPKPTCVRGTATDIISAWITCDTDVADIPAATNHVISSDITFTGDEHWYTIGLNKVGSSYEFASQGEGDAKQYINTVILQVSGVGPVVSAIVTGMIRGTYNLLVKDKNGNIHLIGALGDGADVGVVVKNSPNGYTLTFTYSSADLPYNYTGAITAA
jgi:hypothetical protein